MTFIDTPGLVDGDMQYPFDVNETITWLGDTSDLVFVLFDPLGQALCKRTLNIVGTFTATCCQRHILYCLNCLTEVTLKTKVRGSYVQHAILIARLTWLPSTRLVLEPNLFTS